MQASQELSVRKTGGWDLLEPQLEERHGREPLEQGATHHLPWELEAPLSLLQEEKETSLIWPRSTNVSLLSTGDLTAQRANRAELHITGMANRGSRRAMGK